MGLDTTHDCWHDRTRRSWFPPRDCKGGRNHLGPHGGFASDSAIGHIRWETLTPDPIHTLLNHPTATATSRSRI